jgi:ATP-dependent Clp protease ATP-binding subunit ClpA
MKPGISIQIVWPLAAQEAIASEFEFIEPSHLFLGVLKFAELEGRHIEQLLHDPETTGPLTAERDDVRAKLNKSSIEVPDKSKSIRHRLRKRLGKGGHPYDGQRVIHRSPASREVFQKAEDAARNLDSSIWCAVHLLEALLEISSSEINAVLLEEGISPMGAAIDTPYLDKYGRDLTAQAAQNRKQLGKNQEPDIEKDPVCKVVMDYLFGREKTSILLIQKGERSAGEVVEYIGKYFAGPSAPPAAKGKKIVEIYGSDEAMIGEPLDLQQIEKELSMMFQEAIQASNIIMFFRYFYHYFYHHKEAKPIARILDFLKDNIAKGKLQCIFAIDEDNYLKLEREDSVWKKLLRIVWIHDIKVPLQL